MRAACKFCIMVLHCDYGATRKNPLCKVELIKADSMESWECRVVPLQETVVQRKYQG